MKVNDMETLTLSKRLINTNIVTYSQVRSLWRPEGRIEGSVENNYDLKSFLQEVKLREEKRFRIIEVDPEGSSPSG